MVYFLIMIPFKLNADCYFYMIGRRILKAIDVAIFNDLRLE